MGLLKKLVVGFPLLLFIGVAAIFGMQYYYDTAYTKVPVEVKNETVSGDVFYLSHVLEPGKYKITADSGGTVGEITILDENGNVLTESKMNELIYTSTRPFQVRIDYRVPSTLIATSLVGIHRLVKK